MIAGPPGPDEPAQPGGVADPGAVRVGMAPATRLEGDPSFSLAPPSDVTLQVDRGNGGPDGHPLVDGVPTPARLSRFDDGRGADAGRARLEWIGPNGEVLRRTNVLFGPVRRDRGRGTEIREVVVDGWRFEVEIEPERRAVLRERARRGAGVASQGGPVEVRAIIPGRIVAVSVRPGDAVEAGQQMLVVEAMKMQNELRAPREGSVERVGVAVGDTIDVGDLLVVIH
jgi:biotin carboxyl carrier protein